MLPLKGQYMVGIAVGFRDPPAAFAVVIDLQQHEQPMAPAHGLLR